jgi:hypothetical protein
MNRLAVIALMLCLAAAPWCIAGSPTNRFTIDMNGKYLAVSKGRLVLGGSSFGSVGDSKDARDRWYVSATLIKSSVGGGYLAYDPKGEDNAVLLQSSPGEGTEWNIAVPSTGRNSEGKKAVIRAAKGPKKGWYLTAVGGRLILAKDPPEKLRVGRIWSHK